MFFDNILFSNDNLVYDTKEGFMKGNMFPNEYKPFMDFKPCELVVKSDKDKLLLKIYEYDFALNDLSLYLDIHHDTKLYDLFKKYSDDLNKLVNMYESQYGPMEINHSDYDDYLWMKGPWPFSGGNLDV